MMEFKIGMKQALTVVGYALPARHLLHYPYVAMELLGDQSNVMMEFSMKIPALRIMETHAVFAQQIAKSMRQQDLIAETEILPSQALPEAA